MTPEAVARLKIDEILTRDKTSLDIFWIKDRSLAVRPLATSLARIAKLDPIEALRYE